ncbi:DNA polymerase mu [Plakobranchus ocellatus]|uniref:DNA polymerase mu n=1 Tax=Plakobranchus ocellatus TaxID=259542 RepID=A0AAV3Z7S1_9GAST|nr:DNA polymerase mu [Plakobranchus ocellatus]
MSESAHGKNELIFIMPMKFQKKRLEDMKSSLSRKGFNYTNDLSSDVTHVVTECESLDQVERYLTKNGQAIPMSASVVSTRWLVDCLKAVKYVPIKESQVLRREKTPVEPDVQNKAAKNSVSSFPEWACQRKAKLKHFNSKLTSAIEVLQEYAELRDARQDYSRALAFRRASSVLKALPFPVQRTEQLKGLKDIGEHVKGVIEDILDHGSSSEVENIVKSEWYNKMKLFTSIFGVGPSTAKTWIECGWKSVEDAQKNGCPSSDWRISWGLAFFKDLNTPVQLQEAETFFQIVKHEAELILPGVIVTLVGGFRRGKAQGHDVDILLSHPSEGAEAGLLPKLLAALGKRGLILIGHKEKSSFRSDVLYKDFKISARGQLDHFEKWLGICKFKKPNLFIKPQDLHQLEGATNTEPCSRNDELLSIDTEKIRQKCDHLPNISFEESLDDLYEPKLKKAKGSEPIDEEPNRLSAAPRDWLARRVDLIIAPQSQYYYALVGWTGSKHFNRDARLYAQKKLGLKLTSHGLFDLEKVRLKHLS